MTSAAVGDYSLCGWRVSSEIPLAELPAWSSDDRAPDLVIVIGPTPDALAAPTLVTPVLQLNASGQARFHIKAVATYLVEQGRRITIEPHMSLTAPDVRLFLLGTPFGLICHQRGILPLHAAAVEIDGEAVLLAGPSGIGKSTLAAAFWRRGFSLISDDLAPLELTAEGAVVLPGLRRIRLWKDSIDAADWNPATMERCREGIEKYSQTVEAGLVVQPLRPLALIHLQRIAQSAGEASFRRLRGHEAASMTRRQVYRLGSLGGSTSGEAVLQRVSRAAAAIPRHFVLSRPLRFADLDQTVDMIVETVRGGR